MLNKNDPLIAAVQKVMQTNQAEREAVAVVNEKFGVADRRALPRERQHEWDSAYAKVLTEGVEALDELKGITNNTGARAGYMLKGIGSAVKAKLTGDEKTYTKRMKGLQGAKKKSEAETEDASNNETARKVLKDMGRKTGYGKIYDKMFEEESLDEKKNMSKGDIAALRHPKKKITRDDLAALRAGEHKMEEEKKMKDDPCWDTHEMVGMKKKGGREVPNCVPVKEEGDPSKAIRGDVVTGGSSVTTTPKPTPKPAIGEPDQKALTNKIKSIMEKWNENQRNKQKNIADAIARKNPNMSDKQKFRIAGGAVNKMKKLGEGFNDRHNSSVNASVSEQVVADQLNEYTPMGGSAPGIALRNKIRQVGQSQRFRPRGSPTSSVNVSSKGPVSQKPGINAATGSMNATVDQRRAGYNITNVRDTAYGANPTAKKLGPASSTGGEGPPPVPAPNRAASVVSRPGPSFERTGRGGSPSLAAKSTAGKDKPGTGPGQGSGAPTGAAARLSPAAQQRASERDKVGVKRTTVPKSSAVSTAGKDKPGTGPGQGSGAPTGPENIKMATQNTQGNYDKMTFSQAFAAARKQAGGAGGKFTYKGKDYQTNVKGTGTAAKPQEKYQAASKLKTVAPPMQTTTTSSVAGGQGIAALPSGPAKSTAPVPTARPANVGSAGPARPTMAANAQAAGQMAVDRMRAQNMAKSQTSSMSAGMSSTAPAPKSTPPKPLSGGAGR